MRRSDNLPCKIMCVKAHADGNDCEISRFYELKREVTPIYADLAFARSNARRRAPPAVAGVHSTLAVFREVFSANARSRITAY